MTLPFVAKVSRGQKRSWRENLGPDPARAAEGKPHPEKS